MDKYEYKIKSDEIKSLIDQEDYAQAAEIADSIDWKRVKSIAMLCMVSDLYRINRHYEDAKNLLLLAYDIKVRGGSARSIGGICYSLCELCIKTEDIGVAWKYYLEFMEAMPGDCGRLVLRYKLYEAQGVGLEERIGVLEEMKEWDYVDSEKWRYELAYLYHCEGRTTRCVEECDDLFIHYGEGKYVAKAMELKLLHQQLRPDQQEFYDRWLRRGELAQGGQDAYGEGTYEGQDVYGEGTYEGQDAYGEGTYEGQDAYGGGTYEGQDAYGEGTYESQDAYGGGTYGSQDAYGNWRGGWQPEADPSGEMDIQVKIMDPAKCNTMDIVAEVAAGYQKVLEAAGASAGRPEDVLEGAQEAAPEAEELESSEVFFGATGEIEDMPSEDAGTQGEQVAMPPKELEDVLSQRADGQISIVLPEKAAVEKQITGQMNIEDILAEWEQRKKAKEEKRREEVRQLFLHHTGPMFTEYEAMVKDVLLERLEGGARQDQPEPQREEPAEPEPRETGADSECEDRPEQGETLKNKTEPENGAEPEYGEGGKAEYGEEPERGAEAECGDESGDGNQAERVYGEAPESGAGAEYGEEPEYRAGAENGEEPEYGSGAGAESGEEPEYGSGAEAENGEEPEYEEPGYTGEDGEEEQEELLLADDLPEDVAGGAQGTAKVRRLTKEERELFAPFLQSQRAKEQLVAALDSISMAAYTGNLVITGEEGMDTLALAENIMREVHMTDSNFSGKAALVTGEELNGADVARTLERLRGGALIIQTASGMSCQTAAELHRELQQERFGIIVVLEGTKKSIKKLFLGTPDLYGDFTARIDLEALSNDMLVSLGRQYAREKEFSIDTLGVLALHTRIEELQTIDHAVTVMEVKQIVDEAIRHASRKTLGHFFDVLLARRYDDEDMVILTEKDFVA